ncbi:hypothetical protein ACKWTF_014857 [Chironomus riparius]
MKGLHLTIFVCNLVMTLKSGHADAVATKSTRSTTMNQTISAPATLHPNCTVPLTSTLTSTLRTTVTKTKHPLTSWIYTTTNTITAVHWTILSRPALFVTQKLNPSSTKTVVFTTTKSGVLHIEELESGRLSIKDDDDRIFGTEDEVGEFPYLASSIELVPNWN